MFNLVIAELKKLKSSKILLLIPMGSILPVFLMFFDRLKKSQDFKYVYWRILLSESQHAMNICAFSFVILIAGYIITREYQDNTIDQLFAYPIERYKILLCKILVMLPVIFSIFVLSLASTVIFGAALKVDLPSSMELAKQLKILLISVLLQFALVPAVVAVSALTKNMIGVAAMGVCCVLLTITFLNTDYNTFMPWCVPILIASDLGSYTHFWRVNYQQAITTILITFSAASIFSFLYYCRTDVH
jgi:hypothetical protein